MERGDEPRSQEVARDSGGGLGLVGGMVGALLVVGLTASSLLTLAGIEAAAAGTFTDKTVQITELQVPESPSAGHNVTLTCRFRLGGPGHHLYTVNWWRGKDQFYTYKGSNYDPKHAYSFRGIRVVKEASTEDSVVLLNVSEATSGVFKCEVMGEGPSFRTAVKTKLMTVTDRGPWSPSLPVVPPRPGGAAQLHGAGAKPRTALAWMVNGRQVRQTHLYQYADRVDKRGRVTSTLGLRWRAPDFFEGRRATVTCRASVRAYSTTTSDTVFLDTASSARYNHYASGDDSHNRYPPQGAEAMASAPAQGAEAMASAGQAGERQLPVMASSVQLYRRSHNRQLPFTCLACTGHGLGSLGWGTGHGLGSLGWGTGHGLGSLSWGTGHGLGSLGWLGHWPWPRLLGLGTGHGLGSLGWMPIVAFVCT
ncbi:hypothetical protein GWK47_015035 [Chionoecetes opilio]|uniref:Ig-like domain-containing protein n=1 Tax=Chionoecetes opilio TaxID=41210 RepID=A0A8J5CKS0_CHIOP|nr:hypothetical protein GWK47_015035 [Chionoecetes opilio]